MSICSTSMIYFFSITKEILIFQLCLFLPPPASHSFAYCFFSPQVLSQNISYSIQFIAFILKLLNKEILIEFAQRQSKNDQWWMQQMSNSRKLSQLCMHSCHYRGLFTLSAMWILGLSEWADGNACFVFLVGDYEEPRQIQSSTRWVSVPFVTVLPALGLPLSISAETCLHFLIIILLNIKDDILTTYE